MTNTEIAVRSVAALVGLGAALLNGFGAWEAQLAREGGWNYLTIAAPFVVGAAALVPVIAERLWTEHRAKSVYLWLSLLPVAVLAFFAASERVHGIRAADIAERASLASAVALERESLSEARASLTKAKSDAAEALTLKACRDDCRNKWAGEIAAAQVSVDAAIAKVSAAEALTIPEAPYSAPYWLLPLCLDLLNFGGLWIGLAPRRRREEEVSPRKARSKPARRTPSKHKASQPAPRPPRVVLTGTNDNVLSFPPAI